MTLTKQEQFFYDRAGYSYHPETQTPEQGREECARRLAAAETWARDAGYSFAWEVDPNSTSADWYPGPDSWSMWRCLMHDRGGVVVGSLDTIDFGRDGSPWGDPYRRVVEAELALEAQSTENLDLSDYTGEPS